MGEGVSEPNDTPQEAQAEHSGIEEAREQVEEARHEIARGDDDAAMARLSALEARLNDLEQRVTHSASDQHTHEHQWPKGFKQLLEALDEFGKEEVAPSRQHPLYRKLRTED